MNDHSLLVQALVYLAAGVISAPIAKRLGMSSILGYLVAGVLIGPSLLGWVGGAGDVMRFAEFGVVILLFLIGLEVRPALLWRMRTTIFGLGAAQLAATTGLLAAGGLALGMDPRSALAVGLILSMSSTAIVLQGLEERGLRQSPTGAASFGVLLFQDLAVIPLFALLPLLAQTGARGTAASAHAGLLGDLPPWLQALAVLGAVAAVLLSGLYLTRPLFRFIAAARLREIFTATALLLVVGVAALMEAVGLSPALGAFLAGVVLAESEFRRELETDIEPFRGLLLGLFFITVGAGLDLAIAAQRPAAVLGMVLAVMVAKTFAMYAAARLFGRRDRHAWATAVSLAQVGEFAFVLLGFAAAAGVLQNDLVKLLGAVAAVTMALTPLATAAFDRIVMNRAEARPEPERLGFDDDTPDVIVAGFGRFGQIATRLLIANDFKVVLLDSSIEQIETIRQFGWRVHYGDASRLDLLRTAGADKAKLLLIAIDDRDKAVEMAEAAREAFPNLSIMARAYDRRHAYELLAKGVDDLERETFEGSLAFGRRALVKLGMSERRATRMALLFREQDRVLFRQLAPMVGEEERYVMAYRDSRETMERLLRAEMARLEAEDEAESAAKVAESGSAA